MNDLLQGDYDVWLKICCAPWGGSLFAMLKPFWGLSWKAFEATWVKLGDIWDYGGAIFGLIGRS